MGKYLKHWGFTPQKPIKKAYQIFDAAGIKKPEISGLSDDFLAELKNHQRKNIALEMLKKTAER